MAVDPSIILGIKPPSFPSPMATVGSFLDMQKTQQAIQAGQIANQGNQYTLDQRMALKNFVQNDPRARNSDGSINVDAVSKLAPVVAPELGGQVSQSDSQAATANTQSQAAQFGLNKNQWDEVSTNLGSLRSTVADKSKDDPNYDPAADILQRTTDLTKAGVISPKLASSFVSSLPDTSSMTSTQKAQTYDQWIVAHQQSALGASAQANLQTPQATAVAGKKGTQLLNTNANAPGLPVGTQMGPTITPPSQVGTTPGGAPAAFNPGDGTVSGFSAPPPAPGAGSFATQIPAGESAQTGALYQQQRQDGLAALRNAPNLLNLNQGIRDITSKGIALGTGGQNLQKLASYFGYQLSGEDATDRNMLTKKIAQATLASAAALPSNPATNAGLQELQAANGSTATDAKTLTAIADRSSALINGTKAYMGGLNAAMQNAQTANPDVDPIYVKPTFDQQWAANFDPDMTMYAAAKQRGDTAAMNAIIASHGGKGSKGAIDFATRANAVNNLQRFGTLQPPQGQ